MTSQIPDTCTFNGRQCVIESWEGSTDCIPTNEKLGINTVSTSTANWSGRIDHFKVYRDKLFLLKIEVNLDPSDSESIPNCDRRETLFRYEKMIVYKNSKKLIEEKEYRFDFLIFDDLFIPFTGTLYLSYSNSEWEIPTVDNDLIDEPEEIKIEFIDGILQKIFATPN